MFPGMTQRKSSNPPINHTPSSAPVPVRELVNTLEALVASGALAKHADGTYAVSEPPPAPDAMVTLVCRIPQAWLDTLDAMGPTRSEAARRMLGKALAQGSGTYAAVRESSRPGRTG
jgi:hypothetical protein